MRKAFRYMLKFIFVLLVMAVTALVAYEVYKKYILTDASIESAGALTVNYQNGSKVYVDGEKKVEFSIINSSDEDVYYYVSYNNPEGVEKGKIKYTLNDGDITATGELDPFNTILANELVIHGNEIKHYTLTFESKSKFSLELDVELEKGDARSFADIVLDNNKVKKEPTTKPGVEVAIKDEGLIESTDDNGVSYYFRGNVKNNYVKIGNYNFRIVRITGDGSVRIILDGVLPEEKAYYMNIGDYSYHGSYVSSYLNKWLDSDLKDYGDIISNYKFCNDNNANNGEILNKDRIVKNNIPSFICLGETFSVRAGLLSVDEMILAGGTIYSDNTEYYLYNPSITSSTYSMTGYNYDGITYYPFMLNSTGKITYDESGADLHYIRPVVNINKTAKVTGSGTQKDPYVLTK